MEAETQHLNLNLRNFLFCGRLFVILANYTTQQANLEPMVQKGSQTNKGTQNTWFSE